MTKPQNTPIDLADLTITDEPFPGPAARNTNSKYEALFSRLPPNKRLRCPEGATGSIAGQLRKYLAKNGKPRPLSTPLPACQTAWALLTWPTVQPDLGATRRPENHW